MKNVIHDLLLILGALLIIACGWYTVDHLHDRVVFTVLIPGFVGGLILIGIATQIGRRKTVSKAGGPK